MNRIHFIKKLQDQKRSLQKNSVECFKNQPKIAYYVQKPPFKIIKPKNVLSLCHFISTKNVTSRLCLAHWRIDK